LKALVNRISANPRYSKVFHWSKLISITGGAQVIVQGTGLICGILVIRLLPVQEYALYTIANTMLGTISLLADGGISTGVMAEGGKIWKDKDKMGSVLATGLYLRKKFAIWSLIVSTPILVYLLLHHGASWLTTLLIIASLIPAFFAALSDSLLEIVPKLHQDIISLQKNQLTVSIGRLVLSALLLFIFPFTFIAVLAAGIPRAYGNINLRNISGAFANKQHKPNPAIQKKILSTVKKILPGSIYYCLSGQITIWLISIFGTSSSVAEVGALGRLAMLLTLLTVLFNTLVIPRFARLPGNSNLLLSRFVQLSFGLTLIGVILIGIVHSFSAQALWILGSHYSNLKSELTLSIIGSFLGLMAGTLFSLNTSRGWALNPAISISINLVAIIAGIALINIHDLKGLFKFNIFVMGSEVLMYLTYGLKRIIRYNDNIE
jgi:O-antigen/teichoic acid export membrane protein